MWNNQYCKRINEEELRGFNLCVPVRIWLRQEYQFPKPDLMESINGGNKLPMQCGMAQDRDDKAGDRFMNQIMERSDECFQSSCKSETTKAKTLQYFRCKRKLLNTVGEPFIPNVSFDLKYKNDIKNLLENVTKELHSGAFGHIMSHAEPVLISNIQVISRYDDLQKLFKDMTHLSSVQALIEFYRQKKPTKGPSYLVQWLLQGDGERKDITGYTAIRTTPAGEIIWLYVNVNWTTKNVPLHSVFRKCTN